MREISANILKLISKPFKVDALVKKIDGLTIGGQDGNGADGKLAEEVEKLKKGEELKEDSLMKGEREHSKDERKQKSQQKSQEQREDMQEVTTKEKCADQYTKDEETEKKELPIRVRNDQQKCTPGQDDGEENSG